MDLTGSLHHVQVDDASIFPWGSGGGDPIFGPLADSYFASDGDFNLGEYRSQNEKRTMSSVSVNFYGSTNFLGRPVDQKVGAQLTHFLSTKPAYKWPSVGTGNVYSGTWSAAPNSSSLNDVFRREFLQTSVYAGAVTKVLLGEMTGQLRFVSTREGYRADFYPTYYNTIPWGWSETNRLVPSLSYSRQGFFAAYRADIEAGAVAPLSSQNNGTILPARRIDSFEVGSKHRYESGLSTSAVLFYSERPYNFRNDTSLSDPAGSYIQRGTESRTGLELSLSGALTKRTDAQMSATLMTSDTSGTGNPLFEGKEALNTPKFRLNTFVNYRVPGIEGLSASANWLYTGKRPASRDNSVYAPDFHRLDLGLSYVQKTKAGATTYRLAIENVTDERYWRDVAEVLGDAYPTPGGPRLVKASATVSF